MKNLGVPHNATTIVCAPFDASTPSNGKFFTGIHYWVADSDGQRHAEWAPVRGGPQFMEDGIRYSVAIERGESVLRRIGHRFDV